MSNLQGFDQYYAQIYGERWAKLQAALLGPELKVNRPCFSGFAFYTLDPASVIAAQALDVRPRDEVLDMCAAPGGKSLVLLEMLQGQGHLTVNEFSKNRKHRLKRVIDEHVPENLKSLVNVTGFDGNQFGLKKENTYDRILLDAPCSSERHLMADLKDWKVSRTQQLAMRQYSLVCSALLALKPGGMLLYSTCSISPLENDGVIERVLKKKSDMAILDLDSIDLNSELHLEKTKFGFQIFPDLNAGAGPIYFSKIRKLESNRKI